MLLQRGGDSDILISLIERARTYFSLPPVKYIFFDTGLEMAATKRHVKETAEKYGVEIETIRPDKNIVRAVREYGQPLYSKHFSSVISNVQKKNIVPLDIADEYEAAEDKPQKYKELTERYPHCKQEIKFLCSCAPDGEPIHYQTCINSASYFLDYLKENPIPFRVSAECCNICKKAPAKKAQKGYDMVITGERLAEGGVRAVQKSSLGCYHVQNNGQVRLRPLYWVSDKDKAWYKEKYNIRYSDAYEVYGLLRTGCCGCSISARAAADLEKIRPYEPNLVKAAWNVFGDSYRYRQGYVEYREKRKAEDKKVRDEKRAADKSKANEEK